jgi:hypothetical protein
MARGFVEIAGLRATAPAREAAVGRALKPGGTQPPLHRAQHAASVAMAPASLVDEGAVATVETTGQDGGRSSTNSNFASPTRRYRNGVALE